MKQCEILKNHLWFWMAEGCLMPGGVVVGGGCHKTLVKARLGQASESGLGIENWGVSEEFFLRSCRGLVGFPGGSVGKESVCNAGNVGSIPGLGSAPERGNGNPLQYSCMENPTDRGAWRPTVHRVAKSQPRLKRLSTGA